MLTLLPTPRDLTWQTGHFKPQKALPLGVDFQNDPAIPPPEGYRLTIAADGIHLAFRTPAGRFYGLQTLRQIERQADERGLPFAQVEDSPDFAHRGVMLDISRDKVPTMDTLYRLVDLLAEWKINQLQLYTEHTFAYRSHRAVWRHASPMNPAEIRALDEYCRERFIELVPNQNSLGHMERWLKHPEYVHLAEAPDGSDTPWGFRWEGPFSLNPTDPAGVELLAGLYDELLPNFSSALFNVGCDETFDIGQGRSRDEAERLGDGGPTRLYLAFLKKIHGLATARGKTLQFWGDIIVQKPELIAELPKDLIALEWGYDADHPFDRDAGLFAAAGVRFYVCPGTSSWNSIAGRTDNALANLIAAADMGKKHGAEGYLITDWGDHGHWQYLPVSYLGFAAGAAMAWCGQSNRENDWAKALDLHAFDDPAGAMGRAAMEFGNVYQACGVLKPNGSTLFRILQTPSGKPLDKELAAGGLERSLAAIASAKATLATARPADGRVLDEYRNAAALMEIACRRGLSILTGADDSTWRDTLRHAIAEHRRLWRSRNREGGLGDSCEKLARALGWTPCSSAAHG